MPVAERCVLLRLYKCAALRFLRKTTSRQIQELIVRPINHLPTRVVPSKAKMSFDDLIQLRRCKEGIMRFDARIKYLTREIRTGKDFSCKAMNERIAMIKADMNGMGAKIDELERLADRMKGGLDHSQLLCQVKRHREELERNHHLLRQATASSSRDLDDLLRSELFEKIENDEETSAIGLRKRIKSIESARNDSVALSEATTSQLIHSSSVIKRTETEFSSMSSHIQSGGKLISKYGRKECTDKILVSLALLLYCIVIFYILHKRVFSYIY